MNNMTIRLETKNNYRAVEELTREAFWNVYKPGCNEHYYAHMMRLHEDFIPKLSLVMELGGEIIGSIMYAKSKLIDENGMSKDILSFGPICISPKHQRKGLGKKLIEHSFNIAREMGYDTVVIFGNPANYVGCGFVSCKKKNVQLGTNNYPTALLVCELSPNVLDGKSWQYIPSNADACCEDTAAVEEFDASFPPKQKAWMPSQEEFYIYCNSSVVR